MPIVICLDDRNVAIRTCSSSNHFPFSILRDPQYSNFSSNVKITVKIDVRTVIKEKIRVKPIGYETFHLADVRITLTKMITRRYA